MSTTMSKTATSFDQAIDTIASYVSEYTVDNFRALNTARACLADTLGCGLLALQFPECTKLLGPVVPGTIVPNGARVPGTNYVLDPIKAAFNIGTIIRWLDFNDTWLAAEWGHPSDNLGGILATCDFLSRKREEEGQAPFTVHDLLCAMIKAHEIQGDLALENSFNRIGFDHVILVKVASAAVVCGLLGGTKDEIAQAVSQAWIDTGPLRTYHHKPNTGSRKSWAAGDATSRGTTLAWMTMQGEKGYRTALTAKDWGFYDVLFKGKPFVLNQELDSYVMENILFKISFPAEFHAQTAVEAAITLHKSIKNRFDEIERVEISTHESAVRIIDKQGPLHNPADRDHCLQYMVAIGLLFGELRAEHYEESTASDPRIDALREKMFVKEEPRYTKDYLDPSKHSIANALTIVFKDGTKTETIEVEYPIGHLRRREEGIPVLFKKFERNLRSCFDEQRVSEIMELFHNPEKLDAMPVHHFSNLFSLA